MKINMTGEGVREFYRRQGALREQKRIIALLAPYAQHEDDCWGENGLECYIEDCRADAYQHAIERIEARIA